MDRRPQHNPAGVTIGDGAAIATGSVATKDVEAGTLAAGNPARFIKRLDAEGCHAEAYRILAPVEKQEQES